MSPEFQDRTPVIDSIKGLAEKILNVPEDSKFSVLPVPEEELEFGQTNVFTIPTNLEQTLEIFKPTLSLLGTGVTVPANIVEGVAKDISGGSSTENLNAIRRILAGNPAEGDEIFVGDLLKGAGLTDESLKLPEGTIDRVGLIGDFIAFAKIDRLARFVFKVTTSKNPAQTFTKEVENVLGRTGETARVLQEALKSEIRAGVEPVARFGQEALEFGGKFKEETGAIVGSVAMAGSLALLGGEEVEAGTITDVAKKIIGLPRKGIQKLDPLRLFPEKPLDVAASGFRVHKLVKERAFNIEEAFIESTAFIN